MDRISDSGSDDLGSNPGGVTNKIPAILLQGFLLLSMSRYFTETEEAGLFCFNLFVHKSNFSMFFLFRYG
jgi:hypothetical protein